MSLFDDGETFDKYLVGLSFLVKTHTIKQSRAFNVSSPVQQGIASDDHRQEEASLGLQESWIATTYSFRELQLHVSP